MLVVIAILAACLFAFNIGASGSAASMSITYGTKVIKRKKYALIIAGLGALAGAVLGGQHVTNTLGKGIIPEQIFDIHVACIILLVAGFTLLITNYIGIPLSTSEVTVGAIVGVGLSFQQLNVQTVLFIISFWLIIPVVAFLITLIFEKIRKKVQKKMTYRPPLKVLTFLLLITGIIEAIAAGMNNVANALGPLVGADILSMGLGLPLMALVVAIGSIFFGGRVLETNAKKITSLSIGNGIVISGATGGLVLGASLLGIPIPMTQVTTSAIVGINASNNWKNVWKQKIIHQIAKVWVTSPIVSLVIAFALTEMVVHQRFEQVILLTLAIVATFILVRYREKPKKALLREKEISWRKQ
ncbi:inorganic phosphate transporter [Gracilibacillus sp. S3-1-1]|uniref:Inorganic phosphate transporter n=1 Tax=Gracilibacillus pellucidus TaxID=3095368 RepID=A0ACC6M8Y9_9BACI|nr:inorganic phosphate transporter [Gracilibacillus sp. S3-1-1]MDX8047415.1 inorganic phosphate transporter [Gracilibacillus sp. S3-1-1]